MSLYIYITLIYYIRYIIYYIHTLNKQKNQIKHNIWYIMIISFLLCNFVSLNKHKYVIIILFIKPFIRCTCQYKYNSCLNCIVYICISIYYFLLFVFG